MVQLCIRLTGEATILPVELRRGIWQEKSSEVLGRGALQRTGSYSDRPVCTAPTTVHKPTEHPGSSKHPSKSHEHRMQLRWRMAVDCPKAVLSNSHRVAMFVNVNVFVKGSIVTTTPVGAQQRHARLSKHFRGFDGYHVAPRIPLVDMSTTKRKFGNTARKYEPLSNRTMMTRVRPRATQPRYQCRPPVLWDYICW